MTYLNTSLSIIQKLNEGMKGPRKLTKLMDRLNRFEPL